MADDQCADTQVEGRVTGGVLRGQRVDDELEIRRCRGIAAVESGMGTEELCRRNGDLPFSQGKHIDFCRQTAHAEHFLMPLVVETDIIDDHSIEEPEGDASDVDLRTQFVADSMGNLAPGKLLDARHAEDACCKQVEGDNTPNDDADNTF